MADLRPRNMTQWEFAELLRGNGFPACSKAAVSLAERPKETGVQFTPEARKTAQGLLNSTQGALEEDVAIADRRYEPMATGGRRYGRTENRKNGRKTTVWLDDEMREWVETRAYLEDVPVGEFIRQILREAMGGYGEQCSPLQADRLSALQKKRAASDGGTSKAAGDVERTDCHGPAGLAMTGTIPSTSDDTRNKEENQV